MSIYAFRNPAVPALLAAQPATPEPEPEPEPPLAYQDGDVFIVGPMADGRWWIGRLLSPAKPQPAA